MTLERIKWYLKQLLPLRYQSMYREQGAKWLCIWRMWFGKVFHEQRWQLSEAEEYNDKVKRELRDQGWTITEGGSFGDVLRNLSNK